MLELVERWKNQPSYHKMFFSFAISFPLSLCQLYLSYPAKRRSSQQPSLWQNSPQDSPFCWTLSHAASNSWFFCSRVPREPHACRWQCWSRSSTSQSSSRTEAALLCNSLCAAPQRSWGGGSVCRDDSQRSCPTSTANTWGETGMIGTLCDIPLFGYVWKTSQIWLKGVDALMSLFFKG